MISACRLVAEPAAKQRDASPNVDATDASESLVDASSRLRCPPTDADILVLLTFDDVTPTVVPDAAGRHDATVENGVLSVGRGQAECGDALVFSPGATAFAQLAPSPDWDLTVGSVDFWLRVDGTPDTGSLFGLITRDALGQNFPGHLNINLRDTGRLSVRLQQAVETRMCSDAAIPLGVWTHVALNLGPPRTRLYIDGVETQTGDIDCLGGVPITTDAIDGNDEPWVIGANSGRSDDGIALPIDSNFTAGALDHFRISRVQRDFTIQRSPWRRIGRASLARRAV